MTTQHKSDISSMLAESPARGPSRTRLRLTGWSFAALLLVSAGMADVPDRTAGSAVVRTFYQHTGVIFLAQALSVAAALCFALFATTLAHHLDRSRAAARAGLSVAGAAVLTSVPVAVLAVAHDLADPTLRALVTACDATDVLLFGAIAAFAAAVARSIGSPAWRMLSATCAVISLARAVLLAFGSSTLSLVAPASFPLLVAALATLTPTRRSRH
ncbi:MAG TPA: hypothetical protein VFX33_16350 [Actinomycetales bacterium]|nr:hypothetical protein [Actinomycetales bacterium]